jgi:hypothetical protein
MTRHRQRGAYFSAYVVQLMRLPINRERNYHLWPLFRIKMGATSPAISFVFTLRFRYQTI